MEKKILIWLEDIHQAIDEIEEFLPEKRDFFTFKKDLKTRKAVERNIEIIGEAVKRILNVAPEINITSARKIVDARNRIIHGYDTISDDIIWAIITNDIGTLQQEVEKLINE